MKYLKFNISNNSYALPVEHVVESIQITHISRLPKQPEYVLGAMNLRGKIISIIDSRIRMGLPSLKKERVQLVDQLKQREKEHIKWVNTLQSEVMNNQTISVQRDPTLCNFGKWYVPFMDQLNDTTGKRNNTDNVLVQLLQSFDEPHRRIHELANKADNLIKSGKRDEAISLIEITKETTLKKMVLLFSELYEAIQNQKLRDIIVIVNYDNLIFGITVDSLDSTFDVSELIDSPIENELVKQLFVKEEKTIQILDIEAFLSTPAKVA